MGHDLNESVQLSEPNGPPRIIACALDCWSADASSPLARTSPSGSSPMSSGLLRRITIETGSPSPSTKIPETIHAVCPTRSEHQLCEEWHHHQAAERSASSNDAHCNAAFALEPSSDNRSGGSRRNTSGEERDYAAKEDCEH